MKARIRFVRKPYFNYPPDRLVCPGILLHRAEGRRMWTMVFTVSRQVSALVYEGDLTWLVEPREQDFGAGVRFQLVANPNGRPLDAKLHDNVPGPHLGKRSTSPAPVPEKPKPAEPPAPPAHPAGPVGGKGKVGKANPHGGSQGQGGGQGGGGPPPDPGGGNGGGPPDDPGQGHHPPKPHPKIPMPSPDLYTAVPGPGLFAEGELLG